MQVGLKVIVVLSSCLWLYSLGEIVDVEVYVDRLRSVPEIFRAQRVPKLVRFASHCLTFKSLFSDGFGADRLPKQFKFVSFEEFLHFIQYFIELMLRCPVIL